MRASDDTVQNVHQLHRCGVPVRPPCRSPEAVLCDAEKQKIAFRISSLPFPFPFLPNGYEIRRVRLHVIPRRNRRKRTAEGD